MPKGTLLTETEKTVILNASSENLSHKMIATLLGRSRTVISSFLADPEAYGTKKSPGRP